MLRAQYVPGANLCMMSAMSPAWGELRSQTKSWGAGAGRFWRAVLGGFGAVRSRGGFGRFGDYLQVCVARLTAQGGLSPGAAKLARAEGARGQRRRGPPRGETFPLTARRAERTMWALPL